MVATCQANPRLAAVGLRAMAGLLPASCRIDLPSRTGSPEMLAPPHMDLPPSLYPFLGYSRQTKGQFEACGSRYRPVSPTVLD